MVVKAYIHLTDIVSFWLCFKIDSFEHFFLYKTKEHVADGSDKACSQEC